MPTRDEVFESLKSVFDPEIPVNIVDLGLIYDVALAGDGESDVNIKMTMTSQSCPAAQMLPGMVQEATQNMAGVKNVNVEVVWEPAWGPARISPEGKKILGIDE